jgi:hypothetical protein
MVKFNFKEIQNKKVGNLTQRTIQINLDEKKPMTSAQVQKVYNDFITHGGINPNKLIVRGQNKTQWYSLKGLNIDELDVEGFMDDYFKNKVQDDTSFKDFFQLQFTYIV